MFRVSCLAGLLFVLVPSGTAVAAEFPLFLGDNNTSASYFQSPGNFTKLGDHIYFSTSGENNTSLYRAGGSSGGAELVKYGMISFGESTILDLLAWQGSIYFSAYDTTFKRVLWKSDGTSSGTVAFSGKTVTTDYLSNGRYFTSAGDYLFFVSADEKLYKTDGSDAGTMEIPGLTADWLAERNGILYFYGSDGLDDNELWRTDGTEAGTFRLKDINPGPAASNISRLVNIDGNLYFAASDANGPGFWKSDGTEAGTVKLTSAAQIKPANGIVGASGIIYFVVGHQLWKSDGTPVGTEQVFDFGATGYQNPDMLTSVDGEVLFRARVGSSSSYSIWKSDGMPGGTTELTPGRTGTYAALTEAGGKLYFAAKELWSSDGTVAGTDVIADLYQDADSYPVNLKAIDDLLYFSVRSGPDIGIVLQLDPSTDAVARLSDSGAQAHFEAQEGVRIGEQMYFSGWDGEHGWEPWLTDGTPQGTRRIADLQPGPESSRPVSFTEVNGSAFFFSALSPGSLALFKTDGTEAGTALIKDVNIAIPAMTATAGGEFFFTALAGTGNQLWRSDGTQDGTYLIDPDVSLEWLASTGNVIFFSGSFAPNGRSIEVLDPATSSILHLTQASGISLPVSTQIQLSNNMVSMNGFLYFPGFSTAHGSEVYRSDGTLQGTSVVSNLSPFSGTFTIILSQPVNDKIFIYSGLNRVWISDGTPDGTVDLAPYVHWSMSSFPEPVPVAALGNGFIFTGNGLEPWFTDGTSAGTFLLKDINPSGDSGSYGYTTIGNLAYFRANDTIHGYELWQSDGTPEGTVMVQDISPGARSSLPLQLTPANGKLYFSAFDGSSGQELWSFNPDNSQLQLIEIAPGSENSAPVPLNRSFSQFHRLGENLIFQAFTPMTGIDLWALPIGNDATVSDWTFY